MLTLTPVIRSKKSAAFLPLHLRIQCNGDTAYASTPWNIRPEWLRSDGSITDKGTARAFDEYLDKCYAVLNRVDTRVMTARDIKALLEGDGDGAISFTVFAREYICQIEREEKRWDLWHQAVKSLHSFLGRDLVTFGDLTAKNLQGWFDSLKRYRRASVLYPQLVRRIYLSGMKKYNDPDAGVVRIRPYPDEYLERPRPAPAPSRASRRALSSEQVRVLACADLKTDRRDHTEAREWCRAVCIVSFALAGMNVADLFDLTPSDFDGGKVRYYRAKTKGKRPDGAYMEVTVPPEIRPFWEALTKDPAPGFLLNISARYADRGGVHNHLGKILRGIARDTGLPVMTIYSFRYSFASIAVNECGVPLEEVAFALNHASAHKVTAGYVKKDFSRVDRVVRAVLDKVFG